MSKQTKSRQTSGAKRTTRKAEKPAEQTAEQAGEKVLNELSRIAKMPDGEAVIARLCAAARNLTPGLAQQAQAEGIERRMVRDARSFLDDTPPLVLQLLAQIQAGSDDTLDTFADLVVAIDGARVCVSPIEVES